MFYPICLHFPDLFVFLPGMREVSPSYVIITYFFIINYASDCFICLFVDSCRSAISKKKFVMVLLVLM